MDEEQPGFPRDAMCDAGQVAGAKRGLSWRNLALASLVLTSCSGLMAVSFWTIRADFDPAWCPPNWFLLPYPLWFLPTLIREHHDFL